MGRYYGTYREEERSKIVIGKDTRRSSYMLEYALAAGLTASGADAYPLHVTTTPSVSYVVRTEDFDCGIMISASHNPYYDNGIKLINYYGEKMEEETIEKIEACLDGNAEEVPFATRDKIGRIIDCANGSAWMIAKSVFDALGAETHVINNEPDGLNINNKCGSTHIEALQQYVREHQLDIGFAFDGDADRCLCVDEIGIEYEKTAVGDKYVYENMSILGLVVGFGVSAKYRVSSIHLPWCIFT